MTAKDLEVATACFYLTWWVLMWIPLMNIREKGDPHYRITLIMLLIMLIVSSAGIIGVIMLEWS